MEPYRCNCSHTPPSTSAQRASTRYTQRGTRSRISGYFPGVLASLVLPVVGLGSGPFGCRTSGACPNGFGSWALRFLFFSFLLTLFCVVGAIVMCIVLVSLFCLATWWRSGWSLALVGTCSCHGFGAWPFLF